MRPRVLAAVLPSIHKSTGRRHMMGTGLKGRSHLASRRRISSPTQLLAPTAPPGWQSCGASGPVPPLVGSLPPLVGRAVATQAPASI